MRVLLDSHALLWWLDDSERLGPLARQVIVEAEAVFVSLATFWELGIKVNLGKLELPGSLEEILPNTGFELLGLHLAPVLAATRLPLIHRDPFDRLLIAQAQIDRLTLVTSDSFIPTYAVTTVDATL